MLFSVTAAPGWVGVAKSVCLEPLLAEPLLQPGKKLFDLG
jgi:hypothetical protein